MVEKAKKLEWEVEPEDVTESLPTLTSEHLFLMGGQRKWFLDLESTPGEDAMNVLKSQERIQNIMYT